MERLKYLKIESLESRRIKSDLVLFHNVINNNTRLDLNNSYKFVTASRRHNKYLYTFYSRTDKRKHFYTNRIVKYWNNLPSKLVNCNCLNDFKEQLDHMYFIGRGSIYD